MFRTKKSFTYQSNTNKLVNPNAIVSLSYPPPITHPPLRA